MTSNEIWIIVKKEWIKFFGNKRVLFTTAILPGMVIFILYSVMGNMMHKQQNMAQNYESPICVINLPESIGNILDAAEIRYKEVSISEKETLKGKIREKTEVLLVCFDENFDVLCGTQGMNPNVEIFYNHSSVESNSYYINISSILESYEESLANIFDMNKGSQQYDLASEQESTAKSLSTLLPTVIMGLLFSSCLSVAAESIAGEKERGTLATLLATPVKRSNIALAKVLGVSITALCSGTSSYIGVIMSLPALLNMKGKDILEIYGLESYFLLFLTLFSVILLIIALMLVCSAQAKSIKEATTTLSPFAAGAMLIGMTCMLQDGPTTDWRVYLIPFYNNVQELYSILNLEINYRCFSVMLVSNLVYAGICVLILTKMFKSERVMFG